MKRAAYVGAFLVLAFAITPQPVHTPAQAEAASPLLWRPTAEQVARHTRTAETTPLTTTVRPGDTYGRWATTHCGGFRAWPAIQAANRWPETRIPIGATAVIVCQPAIVRPPAPPKAIGPTWLHPLTSGARGTSCYHTSKRPGHNGIDIPQPSGTPIRTVIAGTVYRKAYQGGGAGYYIAIRHADSIYTQYHHLREPSPLPTGATVAAGQTIGYVGRTGNATGNHLHFEVMSGGYGRHTNPAPFMRARGVNIGC